MQGDGKVSRTAEPAVYPTKVRSAQRLPAVYSVIMPTEPDTPAADPRLTLVHRFFAGTGASYDFMVDAATFGIDRRWKRRITNLIPPDARAILDLACGTGISTLAIAARHPDARIVGVELREEYLAVAREKVRRLGPSNIELVLSAAEDYRADGAFDCISSSYLAKYADLARLIPAAYAMLKPGGVMILHDFTFPPKAYLVPVWRLYFVLLRAIGGPLFPAWKEIYRGLPQLIRETRWLDESRERLQGAGFESITCDYLTAYGSAIVHARKPV